MKFIKNISRFFLFLLMLGLTVQGLAQNNNKAANDSAVRINVYPNPAFGTFSIEAKNVFPESYTVNIYAADGNLVWEMRVFNETIAVTLPGGNYTVQIFTGENVYYKKVVVR